MDALPGGPEARQRLRAILETLAGEKTVEEASHELGLSAGHFHELRKKALEGGLAALEPKPPGRPPATRDEHTEARIAALERELHETRHDLARARALAELLRVLQQEEAPPSARGPRPPRPR